MPDVADQHVAPKQSKSLLGFYIAVGVVAALAVTLAFALTPLRAWYYGSMLKEPQANYYYYARKMIECGPSGTRRLLQMVKGGSYDGDAEQILAVLLKLYARHDVSPQVCELFTDPDPSARAFAAYVAGHLRDERYLDGLRVLAADKAPLPHGWFEKTVADRAATALQWTMIPESPGRVRSQKEFELYVVIVSSGPPTYKGLPPLPRTPSLLSSSWEWDRLKGVW